MNDYFPQKDQIMQITHVGTQCYQCPFFYFDNANKPCCTLDGMKPKNLERFHIKIEHPNQRPQSCPFNLGKTITVNNLVDKCKHCNQPLTANPCCREHLEASIELVELYANGVDITD